MELHATRYEADPEDDECLASVFFQEVRDGQRYYFSLARYTDDDQDDGLIEVGVGDDQDHAGTVLLKAELYADHIDAHLSEETAKKLNGNTEYRVFFPKGADLQRIRAALKSMFRDVGTFIDNTQ